MGDADEDEFVMPAREDVVRRGRPVTLVGYSFGGAVIVHCLLELNRIANSVDPRAAIAADIVCDVVLIGAPIGLPTETWTVLRRLASGRFINGYLTSDITLVGKQWRTGKDKFCGTSPIDEVPGVENISMDQFVKTHMDYAKQMPMILNYLFMFSNKGR